MTSDAKIGLLLGLVFIFIIAFIINGLPKLRGEIDSNSELTKIMMEDNPPGIGWEGRADEVLAPPPQIAEQAIEPQQPAVQAAGTFSDDSGIRYSRPIPGYGSLAGNPYSQPISQAPLGPVRIPEDQPLAPRPLVADQREAASWTIEPKKNIILRPVNLPKSVSTKTYVVTDGDSLGSIAKKFYGSEEGNKKANVAKIFQANRNTLKSPDEIKVGQTLTIPALSITPKDNPLFSGQSFKQVKSIGGQKLAAGSPPTTATSRFYTVKEGDSLWTISADCIGSGARYKEIAKLNLDILPNEDDLRVGTRLKIPAR